MGKINILDEHIANQIAAGEVVERPSSVVKELVENAVDAGSSRIDIAIEEGGLQLIRVSDNGSGMDADDVEKAFFRHATSKIASTQDLFSIRTLGFRGEALPSIGAVAKVECLTSPDASGLGTKLVIEGGNVKAKLEAASPRGTDLAVRELFYNTPARLKYMKTIQTELGHVTDYIYRLALSHPGIAFTLKHNGQTLIQTLGNGDLLQVVAGIYGTAAAKSMLPIRGETLDYKLEGYIAKPELTRANRNGITTVINGRYVRNFAVVHALLQGFHTLLPINRFPLAALHIQMDPTLIDVNVHPAKLEVRFSKEPELIQFIEHEVRALLGAQRLIPAAGLPQEKRPREAVVQEQLALYRPQAAPSERASAEAAPPPARPADAAASGGYAASGSARRDAYAGSGSSASASPRREPAPTAPSPRDAAAASEALLRSLTPPAAEAAPALPAFPKLHPIGQMHGTYIVAQNEEGLFLIDQHAAHERINYEHYYDQFGKPAEASQELLVPITLEFTAIDAAKLADKLPQLEQAGVYLEAFGGSSYLVRAYPHWLPKGEEQALVEEMIEWLLSEKKQVDIAKLREKAAIMCSCKASIKANQSIGTLEIEVLLDRLAACRNPYTCPHGRPIVVSFSTYELEKMFKRVM
ncbi:DNA mismatch repair endonuclease MutL [Paenibacillus cremeus]|uniref:DNA mismatch repair protein MutL n=1 Tax=Paenibacillus cremeus TaxID=2163881 RepID=A0A559JIF7_9BACL|nr:DNA mismatch repair endonuclease MutL [Paenibacillus cremeus]TVX99660.1 DNA mismatch repair endonuclease MutL [Paenibacillus cremeus]